MKSRLLSVLFIAGVVMPGLQAQLCYDDYSEVLFSLPESQDINPYNYTFLALESYAMLTDMFAYVYGIADAASQEEYLDILSSQAIREAYRTSFRPFCNSIKKEMRDTFDLLKHVCQQGFDAPEHQKKKVEQQINDLVVKIVPYISDILQKDGSPEALRLIDDIKLIQEDIKANLKALFDSADSRQKAMDNLFTKYNQTMSTIDLFPDCADEVEDKKCEFFYILGMRTCYIYNWIIR